MEPKRQPLQVELGEKESEGIYSNMVLVGHTPAEFILDFARVVPGVQKAKVYARILMTPQHAKTLMDVLEKNVRAFEEKHGAIKRVGAIDASKDNIGFHSP